MSTQGHFLQEKDKSALRSQLRVVTASATEQFLEAAQAFYDEESRSDDKCLELIDNMIVAINKVLEAGDWDSSLFLKTTIKPLRNLLNDAQAMRKELLQEKGLEQIEEYVLQENEEKLYVSLYQADGHDLARWALQLSSIDKYMMGRPVYRNEVDVVRAIRRKLLQTSEGYAVIVVDKTNVMQDELGDEKTDRHGFALVTVEQGVVKSGNVIEFVHGGKRYHYRNHKLFVKQKK